MVGLESGVETRKLGMCLEICRNLGFGDGGEGRGVKERLSAGTHWLL